jgi:prepilin-type N-terminal cleavage/methylation domain-containing protein/prepilin-type processing-associated H-X9-DG protein
MRSGKGFTLIELLVVIAVIVLLMALLIPTLQRVKKQTKTIICQSNLRQWGTFWAASVSENDGHFPKPSSSETEYWTITESSESWEYGWGWGWSPYWNWGRRWDPESKHNSLGIRCCPMAAKPAYTIAYAFGGTDQPYWWPGGTFVAWGWSPGTELSESDWTFGSYGTNVWACTPDPDSERRDFTLFWTSPDVKGANNIPVQLDSCWVWDWWYETNAPPEYDAIPIDWRALPGFPSSCINRHNGSVNGLFMDWSVRKVGLKELWTLKWHRQFETTGPWTKAGGVKPDEWPQWMRRFKDY